MDSEVYQYGDTVILRVKAENTSKDTIALAGPLTPLLFVESQGTVIPVTLYYGSSCDYGDTWLWAPLSAWQDTILIAKRDNDRYKWHWESTDGITGHPDISPRQAPIEPGEYVVYALVKDGHVTIESNHLPFMVLW